MALVVSAAAQTPLYTFRGDAPYDWFGNVQAEVNAPCDGQIFGLRTNPTVHVGDWCSFYAQITHESTD